MTILVNYASRDYAPGDHGGRYVRRVWGGIGDRAYAWCERDLAEPMYDCRQGTCAAEDVPADIREVADRRCGHAFSYVEWP